MHSHFLLVKFEISLNCAYEFVSAAEFSAYAFHELPVLRLGVRQGIDVPGDVSGRLFNASFILRQGKNIGLEVDLFNQGLEMPLRSWLRIN